MPRKQHKYYFTYKTTNLINGKYYVGMHSTSKLNDGYLGSGTKLRRSIRKYGKKNFQFEILEFFDSKEELVKREAFLVNEKMLKDKLCMNLKKGGSGGFCNEHHRRKFLKAGKKSMLIALKNGHETQSRLWKTDESWIKKRKAELSLASKGNKSFTDRKHKEESKLKIGITNSIKQKGVLNSQFGTQWITNGIINKKIKKDEKIPNGWKLGRIIDKK